MADYKVTDTELTSIANAIRTKGGTQAQLEFPTGFVSAVQAIPTGGGGVETQIYSPIINTDYVSEYSGEIVASGNRAYFNGMFRFNNTLGVSRPVFTIPEAIRTAGYYVFTAGNGAGAYLSPYVYVNPNGEVTIPNTPSNRYMFVALDWPIAKTSKQVTYDDTVVNTIVGGISVNDDFAEMSYQINLNSISAGWKSGIITIPNDITPVSVFRPTVRYTDSVEGNIADSSVNEDMRTINIYLDRSRGANIQIKARWKIAS